MNGQEIVTQLRLDLDDVALPYLWSDAELLRMANEAEREAVRRAILIRDDSTAYDSSTRGICSLEIHAGTGGYSLSPFVLQVLRVKLPSDSAATSSGTSGYGMPLKQYTRAELDDTFYDWENTSGTPEGFISEVSNELYLVPGIPPQSMTAKLIVNRLPLADFTLSTSPEIDPQYHIKMLSWAKKLAYLKNDQETLNLQLSEYFDKQFEKDFGVAVSFSDQNMRRKIMRIGRLTPRTFGYGG